jgi:hypothetical protein
MQQGCPTSSPSALAWHEEIIDNREDEQCQQKPVEYRFPFALEKLVCVHFPFAFSPISTKRLAEPAHHYHPGSGSSQCDAAIANAISVPAA